MTNHLVKRNSFLIGFFLRERLIGIHGTEHLMAPPNKAAEREGLLAVLTRLES